MAKHARQPIAGWRNEALVLPIRIIGKDCTGLPLRAQVRLAAGTPGPALVDLATVANGNAEGIRLASVTLTDGVPTSNLMLRVNKSSMQALPASGELGAPTALAYALQIDNVTRLHGAFVVLDSAIDADNNQANRLPAYGSSAAAFGVADGLTLTIGNDGVTVTIDGASELARLIALATVQADRAKAEADRAAQSAGAALASIAAAGVRQADAERAAASAISSAATADTARQAVLQAIDQVPSGAVLQMQAASRDILRGFTTMAAGTQAYLGEAGREGTFVWRVGDYSTQIAGDPDQGLYVKANSVSAAQGAWCRVVSALVYSASWWGIGDGHVDTPANSAYYFGLEGTVEIRVSATWQRMDDLLPDGATIMLPAGTMTVVGLVRFGVSGLKSRHIRGIKGKTILLAKDDAREIGRGMFRLYGSNSDVAGVTFRDLRTTSGGQSAAGIQFGGGFYAERQNNPVVNVGYWECTFINMSAPSIIYGSDWNRSGEDGIQRTRGVRIHDNVIRNCDYEYQSIYGVQDVWYYNNDVECDLIANIREFYGFRIIGCRNVYVYANRIIGPHGYPQLDARAFNVKSALFDLPQANPPRLSFIATHNVRIWENDVQDWPFFADIAGYVDGVYIYRNIAVNTLLPPRAELRTTFVLMGDNIDIGSVTAQDNTIINYDALYYVGGGKVRDASFIGNRLRCSAQIPSEQPSSGFGLVDSADIGMFKVINNTIEFPANGAITFRFINTPAGTFAQVWGNVGPERPVPPTNENTMVGFGGGGVKGKVQTAPGGPLYDAETAPVPSQLPNGTNAFAAPGTWAALTRDPNPTTYP